MLTDIERAAITRLIELARAAWRAAEDSEEFEGPDGRTHAIGSQDFDALVSALDKLDELPDDKPGQTLGPAGRAEWALRQWMENQAAAPSALHDAACTAYGWLWLAISGDDRIHRARQALKDQLSRDDLRQGIRAAMAAGGTVDADALEAELYRGEIK